MRFFIIILGLYAYLFSCKEKSRIAKSHESTANQVKVLTTLDTIRLLDRECIAIAKKYAEEYQPRTAKNTRVAELTNVPDSVVATFKQLRRRNKTMAEQYLTLIFLKLYRSHLRCCNQSYELRTHWSLHIDSVADPLLYEYVALTGTYNLNNPIEFISSGLPTRVVELHSYLLENPKIEKEYLLIQIEQNRIAKGVF